MRQCKALTHACQPCGMYPLKGEDYCLQHSDSEKAYQGRILSHYKRGQSGHPYILSRSLNRILRSKDISLGEKVKVMIGIFDQLDECEKEV